MILVHGLAIAVGPTGRTYQYHEISFTRLHENLEMWRRGGGSPLHDGAGKQCETKEREAKRSQKPWSMEGCIARREGQGDLHTMGTSAQEAGGGGGANITESGLQLRATFRTDPLGQRFQMRYPARNFILARAYDLHFYGTRYIVVASD